MTFAPVNLGSQAANTRKSGTLCTWTTSYRRLRWCQVRRIEEFEPPAVQLKDAEVKVAHQLIKALEAKFDASKYRDTFEENVKELIKAHLEGREVTAVEKPGKPAPVVDLMAALKQSLAQMEGKKKPAQRLEAAQGKSEIHAVSKKKAKRKKAA